MGKHELGQWIVQRLQELPPVEEIHWNENGIGVKLWGGDNVFSIEIKQTGAMEPTGPGLYRVTVDPPPPGHTFEGAYDFYWECNHFLHARNKAVKRGLGIRTIELVEPRR